MVTWSASVCLCAAQHTYVYLQHSSLLLNLLVHSTYCVYLHVHFIDTLSVYTRTLATGALRYSNAYVKIVCYHY
jgi:hypothetical protein